MPIRRICLVGATGFIGRHLVSELGRRGYRLRVLTRRRERHRELLVIPTLELVETDVHHVSELSTRFEDCDAVINLAGILNESRHPGESFQSVHVDLPGKIVEACGYNRITRLLHMSALNAAPDAPSRYLRSKSEGETVVHRAEREGLQVTSFRPSVVFGRGDGFFSLFARLLRMAPGFFPLACPAARFAPVFVGDVVQAFVRALEDRSTRGQRYELCGPRPYTLRELVEYTAAVAQLRRRVLPLGDDLSRLQARVLEWLPGKPFSMDNYLSMQRDSVCSENGLGKLGIVPHTVEGQVPMYLAPHGRGALYQRLRSHAGRQG